MKRKIAYLTIDDCPSEGMKKKVDFLLKNDIPAIWFCRGEFLKKRQKPVVYAIKNGFVIGNHSYNHPLFSKISLKECFRQIKLTDELIERAYENAGTERPTKVFRFPWCDKGSGYETKKGVFLPQRKKASRIEAIQDLLRKLGYKKPKFTGINYAQYSEASPPNEVDVHMTYDTMDWAITNPKTGMHRLKDILKRMDEDAPEDGKGLNFAGSNEIVLIHDLSETAHVFEPITRKLLDKGLEFKSARFS